MTQKSAKDYTVLSLKINPEQSETLQAKLYAHSCLGLVEENLKDRLQLKAYFPESTSISESVKAWQKDFPQLEYEILNIRLSSGDFKPAAFAPFSLAGPYRVVPPPELEGPEHPNKNEIVIRPGMAFGTGRHETTQLVAQALLDLNPKPHSLLDVGTGSGILAILGRRLGINKVVGVEICADARNNAYENLLLNACNQIPIYEDIDLVAETFELVLANILAPTLLQLKQKLLTKLKPQGLLILSGITQDEVESIKQGFEKINWNPEYKKETWCCLVGNIKKLSC